MNLKNKLKKYQIVQNYIVLKRYKGDRRIKQIFNLFCDNHLFLCETGEGQELCYNNIIHILVDDCNAGFFYSWYTILVQLLSAEHLNFTPYIEWSNKSPYYEEKGVDGIFNPFEYYYEQPSDIKNIDNYKNVYSCFLNKIDSYASAVNESQLAYISNKYLKIKKELKSKLDLEIKNLLCGKKTLAVHVRGVEWGNIKNHPIPLNLSEYENEIEKAMLEEKFEQIFLATDSEETINYFKGKYGDKLVCYNDVARASVGSKTLAIFDNAITRENNHYLMGVEVLRDMLTMASCSGLIAGHSNVSLAVKVTKLSNNEKFDYLHIFNQKINKNGKRAEKVVEKMKKGKF